MAHHNIAAENQVALDQAAQSQAASKYGAGSTPSPSETPFDHATLHEDDSDDASHDEEPFWRKWLLKLRQVIGFE